MDFSVPTTSRSIAFFSKDSKPTPYEITRRACGVDDVVIEIKYAGICHSDIHQAWNEWAGSIYPMVPGHEIAGVVVSVGANVTDFPVGSRAGVGCMVDSCRTCRNCKKGVEQYCNTGPVFTYNSEHKYCVEVGTKTYGGYSRHIVVDKNYALRIPDNLDLAAATPLLCAGITVYSPMMHFGLRPHMRFAVCGLGGLGHMAVKFAVAFGCHTTVISRGTSKRDTALHSLKANAYIDSNDAEAMKAAESSFDFIISTISAKYDLRSYLNLLQTDGQFVVVGAPPGTVDLGFSQLIHSRTAVAGSLIGGIQETQEMLDFCGRANIVCDIEQISADQIETAFHRANAGDVKYRFVIDASTI